MATACTTHQQQQQQHEEKGEEELVEEFPPLREAAVDAALIVESADTEKVIAFSDPVDFNVVHPLHHSWTLWYDKRNTQKSWSQNLKELVTFRTVEEFWGVYNNIVLASTLPVGATYHFFREGIKPMWEDPANEKGGKWTVQYTRKVGEEVDNQWLNALLACVGEHFEHEEEICGVVLGVRKGFFRLALWTRNATDRAAAESVGRQLKLALGSTATLDFSSHDSTKLDGRDFRMTL